GEEVEHGLDLHQGQGLDRLVPDPLQLTDGDLGQLRQPPPPDHADDPRSSKTSPMLSARAICPGSPAENPRSERFSGKRGSGRPVTYSTEKRYGYRGWPPWWTSTLASGRCSASHSVMRRVSAADAPSPSMAVTISCSSVTRRSRGAHAASASSDAAATMP